MIYLSFNYYYNYFYFFFIFYFNYSIFIIFLNYYFLKTNSFFISLKQEIAFYVLSYDNNNNNRNGFLLLSKKIILLKISRIRTRASTSAVNVVSCWVMDALHFYVIWILPSFSSSLFFLILCFIFFIVK